MGLKLTSTTLFATLISSTFYGMACTLFARSISTMKRKRESKGVINLPLVAISCGIFFFATTTVVAQWKNIHDGFVVYPDGPTVYFNLIQTPVKIVIQSGQFGAIILADVLVIYRTFMIWNSNFYVIMLPCATLLVTFASGVIFFRLERVTDVTTGIFSKSWTDLVLSYLLSSLATTLYSAGFIIYKLWKSQRRLRQHNISGGGHISRHVMRIIVDSAAIYSLNHLLFVVLYQVRTHAESVPSYTEASIASITCSLIIVRCEAAVEDTQILPVSFDNNSIGMQIIASPSADDITTKKCDGRTPSLRILEGAYISRDIRKGMVLRRSI